MQSRLIKRWGAILDNPTQEQILVAIDELEHNKQSYVALFVENIGSLAVVGSGVGLSRFSFVNLAVPEYLEAREETTGQFVFNLWEFLFHNNVEKIKAALEWKNIDNDKMKIRLQNYKGRDINTVKKGSISGFLTWYF